MRCSKDKLKEIEKNRDRYKEHNGRTNTRKKSKKGEERER